MSGSQLTLKRAGASGMRSNHHPRAAAPPPMSPMPSTNAATRSTATTPRPISALLDDAAADPRRWRQDGEPFTDGSGQLGGDPVGVATGPGRDPHRPAAGLFPGREDRIPPLPRFRRP